MGIIHEIARIQLRDDKVDAIEKAKKIFIDLGVSIENDSDKKDGFVAVCAVKVYLLFYYCWGESITVAVKQESPDLLSVKAIANIDMFTLRGPKGVPVLTVGEIRDSFERLSRRMGS